MCFGFFLHNVIVAMDIPGDVLFDGTDASYCNVIMLNAVTKMSYDKAPIFSYF